MAVGTQIQLQLNRMAKGRQTMKSAYTTGDDFWTKVDAAADETYENRVKGSDITALDTALANMSVFNSSNLAKWFTLHNSYFQSDLALSAVYLESYLDTVGWRVPYEANECYFDAIGTRLAAHHVFPKGTLVADEADPSSSGMHKFQTWADVATVETKTVVDGALTTSYGAAMVTSDNALPGGASHALTLTITDGTTKTVTFTPDATQYGQIIVGQQAITAAGAAAGQKVIPVAATAQFKAACYVLLVQSDFSASELVLVESLVANTSLTATANLIGTYAENDLVWPLVTNAVYQAGTLDTGKALTIWARPDMIIAL